MSRVNRLHDRNSIFLARNDPKAIVGTSTEEEMMLYTMRFSLVDRPGALGSVATSLSHVPASIVTLRVVEHDGEYAVDEVVLEAEGASPEEIRAAAQAIPGVAVECGRRVQSEPDPLAGLLLAHRLSRRIRDP